MTKTIREMIEVMDAFERGEKIEWRSRHYDWIPCASAPSWSWADTDYRIAPAIPDYIDWSHVSEEYRFLARDKDGRNWLYERRPGKLDEAWASSGGNLASPAIFASLKIGNVPWDQSLVERPEGV